MPRIESLAAAAALTGTEVVPVDQGGVTVQTTAQDIANLAGAGSAITALTGDVTATGPGSVAATIAASAVTLAKMADVATGTVFYRKTAATGVPEVQTLATLKTDLGLSGTNTGDQDLSSYATTAAVAAGYQPLDAQLTDLAALSYTGNTLKVVRVNAGETAFELATVSAGSGDVVGPASATDSSVALFDSTTGKLIKSQSGITVSANNALTLAGGTITASEPILNLSQTWNAGAVTFDADDINITDTASASGSRVFRRRVGGTTVVSVDKTGVGTFATSVIAPFYGSANNSGLEFIGTGFRPKFKYAGTRTLEFGNNSLVLSSSAMLQGASGSISTTDSATSTDVGFRRKAAGVWEINNGTAGTYTGTAFTTGSQTVAQLPAAATAGAGARAFVTDATATTFASAVTGGGANKVPVYSDGSAWYIG